MIFVKIMTEHYQFKAAFTKIHIFGYSTGEILRTQVMRVAPLTLRLLMSYIYIYGAPSKARNANVVYIWTYVWQR